VEGNLTFTYTLSKYIDSYEIIQAFKIICVLFVMILYYVIVYSSKILSIFLIAGTTNLGVNVAGFTLHSAIHASRPDLKCIVHLHHPSVVAVSTI